MPTYEYRCKDCGTELEVVQAFTDDALTTCEACGGSLRKVFGSIGIAFKGNGFYKTDSRGKTASSAPSGDKSSGDKSSGESSSGSSDTGGADKGSSSTTESGSTTKKKDASPSTGPSAGTAAKAPAKTS